MFLGSSCIYPKLATLPLQEESLFSGPLEVTHEAKVAGQSSVVLWGVGTPKREFLYVDDLADACYHLMLHYDQAEPINVGTGEDKSIKELAMLVREVVGYEGKISRMRKTGWQPTIELHTGLQMAYADFLHQHTRVGALK